MAVYKDKKNNKWYFRVYVVSKGNKCQKAKFGFKTKTDAKKAELDLIDYYASLKIKDDEINFIDLYSTFIKWKKQNLKPQSFRAIKSRFKNHILPYFEKYNLNQINGKIYIDWKETIISKNFSYKYNSSLHGCMVSLFNFAIKFYDFDNNIASKIGNFSKNNYIPNVNFWTIEEFSKFLSVIDNELYYTLFYVLFFTGMRLGECLSLTWEDIEENTISITKTIAKGKMNNCYIITTPKTKSSIRKIKIDLKTVNLLKKLKEYYKKQINFSNTWFVFGGIRPLSQTTISRKKDEFCFLANVKRIKIHDFRHSHATFLLSNGIPVIVISKRLGHSDIKMTLNTYSHLIPEDEDRAVLLIDNLN